MIKYLQSETESFWPNKSWPNSSTTNKWVKCRANGALCEIVGNPQFQQNINDFLQHNYIME